ncbi:MAG: hypothetical protein H6751_12525 [Candidatus Omnitrophica bacterium]|nr:hypothetical protein [Candidatus Omnitrophota bacterium]
MRKANNTLKKALALCAGVWAAIAWLPSGAMAQEAVPLLLSPPDGYVALGPGPSMLFLEWEEVSDAWAYEVRISDPAEEFEDYILFSRDTRLSFGTSDEGTFGWEVRCLYADPETIHKHQNATFGPWSEIRYFSVVREMPPSGLGPAQPEVMFPASGYDLVEGNNYQFKWKKSDGALQYQICLETSNGPEYKLTEGEAWQFQTAQGSGPQHAGDREEGTYQLRVRAIGAEGPGEWCDPIEFDYNYGGDHGACWGPIVTTVDPPQLITPPDEATLNPTPEGFLGEFSWTSVPGAVHYEIKYREAEAPQGVEPPGPLHHGITDPPTSILVDATSYALLVPEAVLGERYSWKVRAIIEEGEDLRPTEFSEIWHFTIGEVIEPPVEGEAITLLSVENATEYPGPEAKVAFAWTKSATDALTLVSVSDATQNCVALCYCRGASWETEIPGLGQYTCQVREMKLGEDGQALSVGPLGEAKTIQVKEQAKVAGGLRVGDLVNDGEVDSGDAIRALRHSTDQDQTQLRVRDVATGDCNGDGRVDSGDAVYMLRKAVGSNR